MSSSENEAVDTPWLSIIIPTLNEAQHLPGLLNYLTAELTNKAIEIIIADGGSEDGTQQIARQRHLRLIHSAPSRSRQLNAGASAAHGRHFWFLHADTFPPANWHRLLQTASLQPWPASFSIAFDQQQQSWWLRRYAAGSRLNQMAFRFGDQSLFVAADLFRSSGGYDEGMFLMEGHELARRLKKHAGGFYLLPADVVTSARRYLHYGVVYTQLVFILIFCLHYSGVSQHLLRRLYLKAFRASS